MLSQLIQSDLSHLCHRLVMAHNFHVFMVRLSVLAYLLQSLQFLGPEAGTESVVLWRRVDLNVEVVALVVARHV